MDHIRKLKRRHLFFYLRVYDMDSGEQIGHLGDLSQDGLLVVSENPIELSKMFNLKINLPQSAGEHKSLKFRAKSLWSNNDTNPNFYDTGFQLFGVSPADLQTLTTIFVRFGFED